MNNNIKERKEIRRKKMIRRRLFKVLCGVVTVVGMAAYHNHEINKVKQQKELQIIQLQQQIALTEKDVETYKLMYNTLSNKINKYKQERDEAVDQYNYINEQIKYSKLSTGTPNRGSYNNKNLTEYPIVTINEMNDYIESVAPSDSPFIGRGETFLKASKLTGLDPYYIFSHASVESGYGKSVIAKTKHNYYGIASFNYNPNNAYHMGSNIDEGIINGALWIKKNYIDKGYNTLNKMIYEGSYCLTDDGQPSQKWADDISYIATQNANK